MSETKRYVADRWVGDGWYAVEFSALDLADAEHFCDRAGIKLAGELVAKIPAGLGAGLLVRAAVWLQNLMRGWRG